MDRKTEIEAIKNYPSHYNAIQKQTLEGRLSDIEISDEKMISITKESSKKAAKEAGKELLNSIPGISTVSNAAFIFMDWNKKVDSDLEDVKQQMLIESYLNKSDDHEKAIEELKDAISDYYGNALINKVFRMLGDYPPDGDLFKHLRSALRKICITKDFERMFDSHKFNLSLIEKMSPQALTILADSKKWPDFNISYSGMSVDGKITDQFQQPFSQRYSQLKGIQNPKKIARITFIVSELAKEGLVECYIVQGGYRLMLSDLGKELYEYLA